MELKNKLKHMKRIILLPALFLFSVACLGQSGAGYDEALAKRLGGTNGMKKYVMAFLKAGPTRPKDSTLRAQLQAGLEKIMIVILKSLMD